jgi:hypothetical protein
MKKTSLYLFALAFFSSLYLLSCQKEFSIDGPTLVVNQLVTTNVTGRVVDENNAPVSGAQIQAGSASTSTDINGMFSVNNATMTENMGLVKASFNGYFAGYRTYIAKQGEQAYITIKLLKKQNRGTISANSGGTLNMPSGMQLTLPASAVVYASNNQPYTGTINVFEAFINPTAADVGMIMPGDLRGIDASNNERLLQSFGMVGIELEAANGQLLQIATGKKADLAFPIPTSLLSLAPASIPLWSFDEARGLWKQEATATKIGNRYEGSVSHFSFWNCDIGQPLVNFKVRLVSSNNQPIRYSTVRLTRISDSAYSFGTTDSAGLARGKVFQNSSFRMEVINRCGQVIHTQNFSTTTTDLDLGTITITNNSNSLATINGTVFNCNNTPVANGWVQLNIGGYNYRIAVTNGNYSAEISLCSTPANATIFAYDSTNNLQGQTQALIITNGSNTIPALTACGVSALQFITVTANGTTNNYTSTDSLAARHSTNTQQGAVAVTSIMANLTNSGLIRNVFFMFTGEATTAPPHRLISLIGTGIPAGLDLTTANIPVTITEFGDIGQFIAGSFSGIANDSIGPQTISGSFRVRRSQ